MSQNLYKTLKHKTIEGVYGAFVDEGLHASEMGNTTTPQLRPYECTMERLVIELEKNPANKYLLEQLKDYELVTIEIKILP